ncbi:MAG: MerR family transcriptional regulator [Pseudomonadota bacterium]
MNSKTSPLPKQSTQQATYSIGIAARMTGISAHTLRIWERRYQLGPSRRSKSGQREFTMTDIDHLKMVKRLTDTGVRIGDIAQLPMKTLSSLVEENSLTPPPGQAQHFSKVYVYGQTLVDFFNQHKQRYPYCTFELQSSLPSQDQLPGINSGEKEDIQLAIVHIDALNEGHLPLLDTLALPTIISYQYASKSIKDKLSKNNTELIHIDDIEDKIADTINRVIQLEHHTGNLNDAMNMLNIEQLPSRERLFSAEQLREIAKDTRDINCECPPHLVELVSKLNAFEEYSKNCKVDNWQQAAIHACIYSYTNQARFLIEKALTAVLLEEPDTGPTEIDNP